MNKEENNKESIFLKNHRNRLRSLILSAHFVLPKEKILEFLLTFAIPRKDTNILAKELIAKFKNINNIMIAHPEQLILINGMGDQTISFLKCIHKLCLLLLEEQIENNNTLTLNSKSITQYAMTKIGYAHRETFIVFLFDPKKKFIQEYTHSSGSLSSNPIFLREFIKELLIHNTSYVVLSHNHPSGDHKASEADIELTLKLKKILIEMEIQLVDHIIVSKNGFCSMMQNGLI